MPLIGPKYFVYGVHRRQSCVSFIYFLFNKRKSHINQQASVVCENTIMGLSPSPLRHNYSQRIKLQAQGSIEGPVLLQKLEEPMSIKLIIGIKLKFTHS